MAGKMRKKEAVRQEDGSVATGGGKVFRALFYLSLIAGSSLCLPDLFYDGFEVPKLFAVQVLLCLALAGWAAKELVTGRGEIDFSLPRPALPLVALFVLGWFSLFWSADRWLAAEKMFHYSALAWSLFFAWYVFRGRPVRGPLLFVAAAGSILAGWGLLLDALVPLREWVYPHFKEEWSPGRVMDHYRLLTSNQGNPNFLFHALVLTVPVTLGAAVEALARCRSRENRGEPLKAALLIIGLLLQLACYSYAANRSGLVATAGTILVFVAALLLLRASTVAGALCKYWKHALVAIVLLSASGVSAIKFTGPGAEAAGRITAVLTGGWENWQRRFSTLRSTENIDIYSRVVFLEAGAAMAADDPWLGKGAGQFVIQFPRYKTEKHWERFNLLPPVITQWKLIPKQAHNEYLQALLELGVVGLLLFVAFWLMTGVAVVRRLRRLRRDSSFYLVLGAASGLAGVLANSLLTFPLQTVTSAMLTWATAGVLLVCCCCGTEPGCIVTRIVADPRKPAIKAMLVVLLLAAAFGGWGAVRIVRAENLFFGALKQHAHDLKSSIRTNRRAAGMMPERYEMQFVQGWLCKLAHDTTGARRYFERAVRVAPNFPPSYRYLADYYYINRDYAGAERAMRRYGELYPQGVDSQYHLMLGHTALRDKSRDRLAEVSEHLRASNHLPSVLTLAGIFLERQWPDSALTVLEPHRIGMRGNHEQYSQFYYLTVIAELTAGDTLAARAVLDTMFMAERRRYRLEGRYADSARELRSLLESNR